LTKLAHGRNAGSSFAIVAAGRVTSVGLRPLEDDEPPATLAAKFKRAACDLWARFG
jgi:hypothetical protein